MDLSARYKLLQALSAMRSKSLTAAMWRQAFPIFADELDQQLRDTKDRTEAQFRALLMFIGDVLTAKLV